MAVWSSAPVGTRIEVQFGTRWYATYPEGVYSIHSASTTVTHAWETMNFKYESKPVGGFTKPDYIDKIVVLFHPNSHARDTFYFDNPTGPAVGPVSVKKQSVSGYNLGQNIPNPASGVTSIGFRIPAASTASLKIYDLLGRPVATPLDNTLMEPGEHSIMVNTVDLPSGLYLYQLKCADLTQTRTMVVSN